MSRLLTAQGISQRAMSNGAFGPPLAAGNAAILLDFCSPADAGYVSGVSTLWTNYASLGFSQSGSGIGFNAAGDFVPGNNGVIQANPFSATTLSQGTIYIKASRLGMSVSNAYLPGLGVTAGFADSLGQYGGAGATTTPSLFATNDLTAANNTICAFARSDWLLNNGTDGPTTPGNSGGGAAPCANSHVSMLYGPDPNWAEIWYTWIGKQWWIFWDGLFYATGFVSTNFPASSTFFKFVRIGGGNATSSATNGSPFGNFPIRRFQLSSVSCAPNFLNQVHGFYGDSYARQGDGSSDAAGSPPTYAQCAAADFPGGLTAAGATLLQTQNGQCCYILQLLTFAFQQFGVRFRWVNASRSGHCMVQNGPGYSGGTASSAAIDDLTFGNTGHLDAMCNIPSAYSSPSAGAGVDYAWFVGCTNDIGDGYPTTLVADLQARFNYIANNNRNLKGIVYIEPAPFPGFCSNVFASSFWVSQGGLPNNNFIPCAQAHAAFTQPAFGSGTATAGTRKVPIYYIPLVSLALNAANNTRLCRGSNPDNTTTSGFGQANQDIHPCAEGHIWYAEQMWPYMRNFLQTAAH